MRRNQVSELFRAATVSDPITLAVRLFGAQSRQSFGVGDIPTGSSRWPHELDDLDAARNAFPF
jgi:hypothetical protein